MHRLGKLLSTVQTFVAAVARRGCQTVEFLGMWGQNGTFRHLTNPRAVVGKDVYGIGIDNNGALGALHLGDESDGGVLLLTQSGTDGNGVKVITVDGFGEVGLLVVHVKDCLGDARLHDVVVLAGSMDGDLSGSGPQTGSR